ncbi:similar to Saccharomyces cerevisiae YHR169W DBP8 ATPase, putative RNA helicase of the DEAD-box family [Maudiozyma barnettii]|uniref:ATP-dependent RNA helicase DBP8 n=1 Tax=Maudiozyma barnettii TaxID=61262 RepID=A0A8H2VIP9_9SACH|nr:ATP-dependent RNA helicase DBP8 [Kazachstania barnettii]CAB4256123.1 similar to Saccharomyces cerevisiae YHR169W DBP8 ATPase, putative RNA helicase of the DEAD-box family [Kazachstania barnettii]CAD1784731.1 similar to Saccharomyces cerevisiae YHR169W DBP8 ATPase, putative RNA helicase of the DEAD-box family [Kazachstania barnettii]
MSASNFKTLGLSKWLVESLTAMKITQPTEIQKHCIPKILEGSDCIGGAKTGSGKTIAFAGPMLTKWSEDPSGMFGIVLTPTRELAMQIAEQFTALGSQMNIRVALVVGGESIVQQAIELQRKPHFIIATPGRLAHHIMNSGDDTVGGLRRVKYLVLDEADFLLTDTFANDLGTCIGALPPKNKRQTLLFTATMTDQVKALQEAPSIEGKPPLFSYQVESIDNVAIPSTLQTEYLLVPEHVKEAYLYQLLTCQEYIESSAIIFVNRTTAAEVLRRTLFRLGLRVASLHSQMPQQERTNSLQRFRANAARILIATDVASRGLDIPIVELVINYDIPSDPDTYIHRSGRTARAGRTGDAISFVTERDISRIEAIEDRINKKMTECDKVHDTAVIRKALTKVTKAKRESLMEMEKANFGERRKQRKNTNFSKKSSRV